MRKLTYLAIFEKSTDGYGISFPDFTGCVSFGSDMKEAIQNAQEALSLHIWGMEEDGEAIPTPSENVTVAENEILVAVSVFPDVFADEMNRKKVKVNCTIPQWIKTQAEEKKVNFSKVLEMALKEELSYV